MTDVGLYSDLKLNSAHRVSSRQLCDAVMVIDFLVIMLCAVISKFAYINGYLGNDDGFSLYLVPSLTGAALFCYIAARKGLYEVASINDTRHSTPSLISALVIGFLLLIAIGYVFKFSSVFSRGWTILWIVSSSMALLLVRLSVSQFYTRLARRGYFKRYVAVLGSEDASTPLREAMKVLDPAGEIIGVFEGAGKAESQGDAVQELIRTGQSNTLDEVYITAPFNNQAIVRSVIDRLTVLPVSVWVCPPELDIGGRAHDVKNVGPVTTIKVQREPITERGQAAKVFLDYTLGTLALIIFAPLFLVAAIAVKLDSPGPVFFRQRRHGFNHQVIDVWKFRTMTTMEQGDDVVQAKRNDPRVTRVGNILRKTSIDELPQLLNVLKGEMSLVGPRPHALSHNQQYTEILKFYANRHRVKPGITGWAQINGLRGPTDDPELMRRRVELDLYYIDHWSVWLDLRILLATPILGFIHKNAV